MAVTKGKSSADLLSGTSEADHVGGLGGNDTLDGGGGNDKLMGGHGDDLLLGGAGNDRLDGGAGDDTLIYDAADSVVRGGGGTDTLRIDGSGVSLDLTTVPDTVYQSLEVIDLTGSGDNALMLAQSDLLAFSSTTDTLRIDGNFGDEIATADAGWLQISNVMIDGQIYAQYTNGSGTLQVAIEVDRSGIGTTVSAIELSSLDGTDGFRLDGIGAGDRSGFSVDAAGDVNGDGFGDFIIGAPHADPGGKTSAGESYVVFGKASGFASSMDLATLDGSNGFRLDGRNAFDYSSYSVAAAGDVNGDGFGDVIVGARYGGVNAAGESYVVFGKASGFASRLDPAALDGTNGFVVNGDDEQGQSGISVATAGDVNGDGFDDVIVGALCADAGGDSYAGESYVVFGKGSGFASSIDLAALDGTNGFRLDGIDVEDYSGISVASVGDVNGDGFDDVIVGAGGADPGGDSYAGESYVVFGMGIGFAPSIDLATLDGTNGFRLDGIDPGDQAGRPAAGAGDVNGDGFDDVIVGSKGANYDGGASYVIFGKASGFASSMDLATLDGTNGFRLDGIDAGDQSGFSVAGAGDVNGDGTDDLIIGAYSGSPYGDFRFGETYVVFGKASGFASNLDLAALDGTNGFRLNGIDVNDFSGRSVAAAGDVNGDGFDDLIVGAIGADAGGDSDAGESYVVFGRNFTGAVTDLGTSSADSITGSSGAETFVSKQGNDTITGGGGSDVFNAGAGNDLIRVASTTFRDVDGGSGTDTLAILGSGRTLDLTTLANNKISGIEEIDITGGGGNSLKLSDLDLFDLSDTTNQLRVDGNAGDTVDLAGTWTDGGAGTAYHTYTLGAAIILIDNDVFVT